MNIRLTSSLTPDDENTLAPALLRAITGILDMLPIAYVLRIETTDAHVLQHGSSSPRPPIGEPLRRQPSPIAAEYR